jgi:transcription-repair coupling factor (superfamily II helicase)
MLTSEARKRLKAIAEFSDLGSGFNIAMRDLDIRGAGNILGAEQSGFISEIGYEMYQKILDEALAELKESEFANMFTAEHLEKVFTKDCQIETDLEILIPDHYVTSINERLNLYKELDDIENEEGLHAFAEKLKDRFGPLPEETRDLIDTVRLRWLAKSIGFEKLTLKFGRMTGTFSGGHESAYFQSERFGRVLQFIKENPKASEMKEKNGKLTLRFDGVRSVKKSINLLQLIVHQN